MDFPTRYDPSGEAEQYRRWEESGAFQPSVESRTGAYFSMVLPPPNATGTLHVGHAVMLAIEDMMVRYHRMKGDRTVWIPGVDHAAIATQNVVEKKLKKENVQGRRTRHELGREAFVREVEQFAAASRDRILAQLRAMGASLDWSRFAYTLDDQRSLAVRTIFTQMYDAGILYRGNRIVNWCPRCKSTLADDEVEYKEEKTPFYYFRYGPVVIGTARPETKFADKTLVVHPDDARYAALHGTAFDVEWIEGTIQANVIADPVIDPSFGTGAMTITPAHSFEDFELAQKYGLPVVTIIDEDGKLTDAAGSFAGRNAREARAEIVAVLQKKGLVDRVDEHYTHNLSVCYRCETPVEPLPKLQWFVDVNKKFRPLNPPPPRDGGRGGEGGRGGSVSLKDLALHVVRSGAITILPERFTKDYFHWMENLRDWCISRQIWFGHRIPVWYKRTSGVGGQGSEGDTNTYVGIEAPQGDGWEQDPDTLDTWFSAGTWTFSTMGWPQSCHSKRSEESRSLGEGDPSSRTPQDDTPCEKTGDLAAFHPSSMLETGYDILFFWVARMILMTEFALGEVPFKTVYLHGLVRDGKGRKMSKSLGNVIDPLDMTQKYGADALRLALFIGTSPGQDTRLDEQKIAGYGKFVTKLWNIARYVAMSCHSERSEESRLLGEGDPSSRTSQDDTPLTIPDHWLLMKRDALIRDVTAAYEAHEYSKAAQAAYDFAWHEFADWYVEATKISNLKSQIPNSILTETLEIILKLLHPAMPFVTEELWSRMAEAGFSPSVRASESAIVRRGGDQEGVGATLIMQPWPLSGGSPSSVDREQVAAFIFLQELVTAIRQLRNERKIAPKELLTVTLVPGDNEERAWCEHEEVQALLKHFARAREVRVGAAGDTAPIVVRGTNVYVASFSTTPSSSPS